MSVEQIGARVAAIQQQFAAFDGSAGAASATSFAGQLAAAQGTTTGTTATTATAATTATTNTTLNAGAPTQYDAQITAAATKYGIDPALLKGLIRQESGFNASAGSSCSSMIGPSNFPRIARLA